MMLDYLAETSDLSAYAAAATLIENAVADGFAANEIRPMEFGGDMGTIAVAKTVLTRITEAG